MRLSASATTSRPGRGDRRQPASPVFWRRLLGENGLQKWAFYIPVVFMLLFFAGTAPDVMKWEGDNWVKTYTVQETPAAHH